MIDDEKQKKLARKLLRANFTRLWEDCIPIDLIVLSNKHLAVDEHFKFYALGMMTSFLMDNIGCSREIADEVTRLYYIEWLHLEELGLNSTIIYNRL